MVVVFSHTVIQSRSVVQMLFLGTYAQYYTFLLFCQRGNLKLCGYLNHATPNVPMVVKFSSKRWIVIPDCFSIDTDGQKDYKL